MGGTRRAVAPGGRQELYGEHPALLADRARGDINATDSEQLFLPGFLPVFFYSDSVATVEQLTAKSYVVFSVSV